MANGTKDPEDEARAFIRVNLPQVDPADLAGLRKAIVQLVKEYPGAEVEVTILPTLPTR